MHPIQSMTLDLNKLSTTKLVELQHGVALQLAARQQALKVGYVKSRDSTEQLKKDVAELHQVHV